MNSKRNLTSAVLHQKGEAIFGSAAAFHQWLAQPAAGLDGQIPLQLLESNDGLDVVIDELIRIEFGDLS